jgi:hypothetical protein
VSPANGDHGGCQANTIAATGLDSPTSILCLQRPSRRFSCTDRATSPRRTLVANARASYVPLAMGLDDFSQKLRQAEQRVRQLKVSL